MSETIEEFEAHPDFGGMRGCEVGGTVTTGVRMYCIHCGEWFAEWSSRSKFPRLQEMAAIWREHAASDEHRSTRLVSSQPMDGRAER